ncbi:hypothetical protein VaNZ11_012563 [Volvox africanus]|uniref:YqgE/AlgH family protein n=1 Tax=Volvox africanus TaxID=51714 RepID=A0ABQ5SFF7_9CHLO|nr:hypothetical protein VaNZ11_012563 [Volvox africanus]
MDSRVSSGRQASTSSSAGNSPMHHTTPVISGSKTTQPTRQSRCLICRSVFDSREGFQGRGFPRGFPTPEITGQDWRAFRAHLVAWEHSARRAAEGTSRLQRPPYPPLVSGNSWAHPLAEPEAGCLLLARRDDMAGLTGAVILIAIHDNAVGSVGYLLNKSSELCLGDLPLVDPVPGFQEAFGNQRMQIGGEVHQDRVTLLHRFVGIRGSRKIAEGMFMGGLSDAIQLVSGGMLRAQDFTLVLGMCGWRPGQLVAEIAEGWWHVIAASPDLVLPSPAPPPTCPSNNPSSMHASETGPTLHSSSRFPGDQQQQQQDQAPKCVEQGQESSGSEADEPDEVPPGSSRARDKSRRRNATGESAMYRRIARLAVRGARRREAASG